MILYSTRTERQTETDFCLLAHYEIVCRVPPPCKELFQSLLNIVRIITDGVLCIPLKVSYVRIFFLLLWLNMKCPIGLTGLNIWSPSDERSTSLGEGSEVAQPCLTCFLVFFPIGSSAHTRPTHTPAAPPPCRDAHPRSCCPTSPLQL